MKNHELLKAGLENFKIKLKKVAAEVRVKTEKPLLICIDELDRCRPQFALEMLESIKHLFEVENVVFILAYDGKQLACSTEAVYGPDFDGPGYLRRFFNLELGLPRNPLKFVVKEAARMGLFDWARSQETSITADELTDVLNSVKVMAVVHNYQLRTIQRILTRMSVVFHSVPEATGIYAKAIGPIIAYSVTNPDLVANWPTSSDDQIMRLVFPADKIEKLYQTLQDAGLEAPLSSSVAYLGYLVMARNKDIDFEKSNEHFQKIYPFLRLCNRFSCGYGSPEAFGKLLTSVKGSWADA